MRVDASQHMRMEQRMKLAPRMIQSMEILQLPLMALEERIEQELAANPVLERRESDFERPDLTPVAGIPQEVVTPPENTTPTPAETKAAEISDREIEQYLQDQADWSSMNHGSRMRSSGERDAKMDAMANTAARGDSLQEELTRQWDLVEVDDRIRRAGYVLIDWVDDAGFIPQPMETIGEHLPAGLTPKDLEDALPILQQRLEPVGICARNLQEAWLL